MHVVLDRHPITGFIDLTICSFTGLLKEERSSLTAA